jgi:uncharacterized integral membrane protein
LGKFLRENWLWIAVPIAIVLVLLVAVIAMTNDETIAPFDYNLGRAASVAGPAL